MISMHTFREILKDKSVMRIMMNNYVPQYEIRGKTLDVGGGKQRYLEYFSDEQKNGLDIENYDKRRGENAKRLDFEVDAFPSEDHTYDSVLMLNLLEHIYNHRFVLGESYRVLKVGGKLSGFVPFIVQVHPDPHDFFRYTKECLERLLEDTGFKNIRVVEIGEGPFLVQFNILMLSIPMVFRVLLFPFYYGLDKIFLKFRPNGRWRYPLGYAFHAEK